jgi:hypothetical protein
MQGTGNAMNENNGHGGHLQERTSVLCEMMNRRDANRRNRMSPALDIADSWT